MKKILAALLAVVLLLGTMPTCALAETLQAGPVSAEELAKAMDCIAAATEKIEELSAAGEVSSAFRDFTDHAAAVGAGRLRSFALVYRALRRIGGAVR